MAKTYEEIMGTLKSLGTEARRKINHKNGAGGNQFGVGLVQLRALAKEIKTDHPLALRLWETGNVDAMLLASMIMDVSKLTPTLAEKMVTPLSYPPLIDEFTYSLLISFPFSNALMQKWIHSPTASLGRAGWDLLIDRILSNKPLSLSIDSILVLIESEIKDAVKPKQEVMNQCLCEIGIHLREYTERCIAIGVKFGRLDDRPVPKGCTSSYAPEWIAAGIKQQENQKG